MCAAIGARFSRLEYCVSFVKEDHCVLRPDDHHITPFGNWQLEVGEVYSAVTDTGFLYCEEYAPWTDGSSIPVGVRDVSNVRAGMLAHRFQD